MRVLDAGDRLCGLRAGGAGVVAGIAGVAGGAGDVSVTVDRRVSRCRTAAEKLVVDGSTSGVDACAGEDAGASVVVARESSVSTVGEGSITPAPP